MYVTVVYELSNVINAVYENALATAKDNSIAIKFELEMNVCLVIKYEFFIEIDQPTHIQCPKQIVECCSGRK